MIVQTEHLQPSGLYTPLARPLSANENYWTYCGLDCCLTLEIFEELKWQFPSSPSIYSFERALQAPYLEIMQRGFLIDEPSRRRAAEELHLRLDKLGAILSEFAIAIWDKGLNPRSPKQLAEFFYQQLRVPEVWISQKGVRRLSTNREALEKIDSYLHARPFVQIILAMRDIGKQLDVLECEIDPDGRFRTSYNIAGTETGRPSSSQNAFGTGGNAQNIAPSLRFVFVADPGWKLCVIDLEQVEARDVGFFCGCLFGDWKFLDNCEQGDLHTLNAKLVWPELPWTGDPKHDRELADRIFYREFSYRDMAKRGGHLSNYSGTAWTMARSLKIPQEVATEFQARYVRGARGIEPAFPAIPRYWKWVVEQLQTKGHITTPFGRQRHFFGRPNDEATWREAIAYVPQSTTADRMNLGLWRVWHKYPQVQLLGQTYDSITFQYQDHENEDSLIPQILETLKVELVAPNGRKYVVPGEAKVGWNWGYYTSKEDVEKAQAKGLRPPRFNPDGLKKFKLGQKDDRVRRIGLRRLAG